jgi:hypothetical protein
MERSRDNSMFRALKSNSKLVTVTGRSRLQSIGKLYYKFLIINITIIHIKIFNYTRLTLAKKNKNCRPIKIRTNIYFTSLRLANFIHI